MHIYFSLSLFLSRSLSLSVCRSVGRSVGRSFSLPTLSLPTQPSKCARGCASVCVYLLGLICLAICLPVLVFVFLMVSLSANRVVNSFTFVFLSFCFLFSAVVCPFWYSRKSTVPLPPVRINGIHHLLLASVLDCFDTALS